MISVEFSFEQAWDNIQELHYGICGRGHYNIGIEIDGCNLTTTSTNIEAIDVLRKWGDSIYGDMPTTDQEKVEYTNAYNWLVEEIIKDNLSDEPMIDWVGRKYFLLDECYMIYSDKFKQWLIDDEEWSDDIYDTNHVCPLIVSLQQQLWQY